MNILVADDDRILAQLVFSRLKAKGFSGIIAFDAMQAWILATRTQLAAIILDIGMPGGTGFEVLRKLKSSAKTSLIPVIVQSGSIDLQDQQKVMDLGADKFVPKPFDSD